MAQIRQSIDRFGFVQPIVANRASGREGIVVGGNQRLEVAKTMGMREVPVVWVDIPDIEKERELNVRLNRNQGQWDFDLLKEFNLDNLLAWGFGSDEISKIRKGTKEDDFDADAEYKAIGDPMTKPGDVYELGKHRLICGDATKREDFEKLMGGGQSAAGLYGSALLCQL